MLVCCPCPPPRNLLKKKPYFTSHTVKESFPKALDCGVINIQLGFFFLSLNASFGPTFQSAIPGTY